tara:strand:+ start:3101 stop:3307 length:207 start_codon:yes stop_codon:yes gene_type:complete
MTTYNLDILEVIKHQIIHYNHLIKEEMDYWRNGGEGKSQVRFDQIRYWKDKRDELESLEDKIVQMRGL